jgi:hypothetical protein
MGKEHIQNVDMMLLSKHPDIAVRNNIIQIIKNSNRIGIKTWGRIDFLVRKCGFKTVRVDTLG